MSRHISLPDKTFSKCSLNPILMPSSRFTSLSTCLIPSPLDDLSHCLHFNISYGIPYLQQTQILFFEPLSTMVQKRHNPHLERRNMYRDLLIDIQRITKPLYSLAWTETRVRFLAYSIVISR